MDVDEPEEFIAPWDGRRVPVTLIGGYLGSGKTTLLNDLLARTDRPIALIVNDVGEINVDAALLRRRSGDTIELTDGCVCCSMAQGLAAALDDLRARPNAPDHLVIELSGVADPTQVIPWGGSDGFRLDGVIVLIDAEAFVHQAKQPLLEPLLMRQLTAADLLVVSKTDLVESQTLQSVRTELAARCPSVPVVESTDPAAGSILLSLGTRRPDGFDAGPPPSLFDPHETERVALAQPTSIDELHHMLDGLRGNVVRAKAIAVDVDGRRLLVQQVGRRRRISPLPAAEDQAPTDLVVVRL